VRAVVVVGVIGLALAPAAAADVSPRLDATVVRLGELVRVTVGTPVALPVYLVPARLVPRPVRCRRGATCEPWSVGPPHRAGWTWLGRVFPRRNVLAFRPRRGGEYRVVVYCAPCYRGPRGSLIASNLLRVR
jgi:hypothetical protein